MKQPNKTYTDTSKVEVYLISCSDAKPIIVNNHYSHKWTSCRFAYGVYYNSKLIGCVVYGSPVGRQAFTSITKTIQFKREEILELTRLWIADGYGTNIESYCIGQTFKYLRELGIRVLISYADPNVGHLGKIYQATNWLYQGDRTRLAIAFKYNINGETLHARTVNARYGSVKDEVLAKIDPNFTKWEDVRKHRYIYILNKSERNTIIKDLKHSAKEYVK
jgi:hypothetical protein